MRDSEHLSLNDGGSSHGHGGDEARTTRVYAVRWLHLTIFSLASASNAIAWITFAPIADAVESHYNLNGPLMINLLSMTYMIMTVPFILPSAWFADYYGMRKAMIAGQGFTAVGAAIRWLGRSPGGFPLVFVGQVLCATGQPLLFSLPTNIPAVWFAPSERATATSVAVVSNMVGISVGFVMPSLFINSGDFQERWSALLLSQAVFPLLILMAVVVCWADRPPTPPSALAEERLSNVKRTLGQDMKTMASSLPFILVTLSFGILVGGYYAVSTVLQQMIGHFATYDQVGLLGALMIGVGVPGGLVVGVAMDRTKAFYHIFIFNCLWLLATYAAMLYAVVDSALILTFVMGTAFGNFCACVQPAALEYAVEVSYPVSETVSTSTLYISAQVFGIVETLLMTFLAQERTSPRQAEMTVSSFVILGCLFVGTVFGLFSRGELKRSSQEAVHLLKAPSSLKSTT